MKLSAILIFLLFASPHLCKLTGRDLNSTYPETIIIQDTVRDDQVFNNGRIWKNIYFNADNDQFLFTGEFLTASITILGRTYRNTKIKYDICNDELITPSDIGSMIQLNKEMVDSFSFKYNNRDFLFVNLTVDSAARIKGYFHQIYRGASSLYMKYYKELFHMSGENISEKFFEKSRLFCVINGRAYQISSKGDIYNAMGKLGQQVKDYASANRIKLQKDNPLSYIPVLIYFDSINK